ncbi:MAG: pilE3 [Noviherbaspirillum sp.]|nr:pilE3 [Noviherbaspirillum sp.]
MPRLIKYKAIGFTLIELLIAIAVVGILTTIALPSYRDYLTRGKIPEATTTLSTMRVQLEQYYQDNRNYGSTASACGVAAPAGTTNFTYSCNAGAGGTNQTFTATATGVGSMNGFVFTINESGTRQTIGLPTRWGSASPSSPIACWVSKKGGGC